MGRLQPEKLHLTLGSRVGAEGPVTPRSYTLTHSDLTGDLFLTIDMAYNREQISDLYTRLMRDEILAEWRADGDPAELHVHCHISGGFALGWPKMRLAIFRREMPLVLEAFRFGDRHLFAAHAALDQAPILVHFHASQARYDHVETWGTPVDYRQPLSRPAPSRADEEAADQDGAEDE